ncbi:DUF3558 domain-containing protein [Mycobacterium riyadhense]|uniref:Lipoprotein LprB n=2 Tax=Mycobacterium riyadhense TaxID=486698 RepID=A0A1X2CW35_9MYCO|nr:DUF3558 domain-containing protein [Mycobacterium riyadhense]MCV7145308.1 DUF3558 domain-containing protein [Mycobacterium riyadhense]ORW80132.1 hypothetical protein AWC22_18390 [Mycobacterium riyadhense]
MSRRLPTRLLVLALAATLLAGCSGSSPGSGKQPAQPASPSATPNVAHGPFFPECGGISDQTVGQLTGVSGLVVTARNSVGCQWLVAGAIIGPWISFSWFRGSPISRERKNEERMRSTVTDINLDGHDGFVAVASDPRLGNRLCDVAIQYDADFFEWSIQFTRRPDRNLCDVAIELSRQSIAAAK